MYEDLQRRVERLEALIQGISIVLAKAHSRIQPVPETTFHSPIGWNDFLTNAAAAEAESLHSISDLFDLDKEANDNVCRRTEQQASGGNPNGQASKTVCDHSAAEEPSSDNS